jgi:acetyltransferase-like isoleucine patch superfamily enzyme
MSYLSAEELRQFNFNSLGDNVKVSRDCRIYDSEKINIGSNVRIDDFCIISGNVTIGSFTHVTPMCLLAGGSPGIVLEDYVTLAYGVKIFAQSDDYSGETMTNSLIPKKFKKETFSPVVVRTLSILGTNSVVMPGVEIGEGVAVGASSLVIDSLQAWGIYVGSPARLLKPRSRNMLGLVNKHKEEVGA